MSNEKINFFITINTVNQKPESHDMSLLNWCLLHQDVGGQVISGWDVKRNAEDGLFISDLCVDENVFVWLRKLGNVNSEKVNLQEILSK
jgi:hypothetical protein